MIVTEAMLAPHRVDGRLCVDSYFGLRAHDDPEMWAVDGQPVGRIPPEWFTHTRDLYFPEENTTNRKLTAIPLLAFLHNVPELPAECEWLALQHQYGGFATLQSTMIATRLQADGALQQKLDKLVQLFHDFQDGHFYNLSDWTPITAYCEALEPAGLTCALSLKLLKEAFYPVDYGPANLGRFLHHPILEKFPPSPKFKQLRADYFGLDVSSPEYRSEVLKVMLEADLPDEPVILLLAENSD